MGRRGSWVFLVCCSLGGGASLASVVGCSKSDPKPAAVVPTPQTLSDHCQTAIGAPRVVKVTPNLFVAVGYDLANTIVLHTPDGNVVVDAMMSPERAKQARAELSKLAPGPTRALIFTHSHIDHVGGASAWLDEGTEIWATARFREHFIKQYGVFQRAERIRGVRQFGRNVDAKSLECSALGRNPDFDLHVGGGIRMPTKTFSGKTSFSVGGVEVELVEAHGETDDELFVWIPSERALLPGDNFYRAFPNLYTIRGTRARPVSEWISSLDTMRRLEAEHLVPSHTVPVSGKQAIQQALVTYRDGIAYVRAAVVRGANAGLGVDELVDTIRLPPHLAKAAELTELYGQVDWSVRAIYDNELGWFDGSPQALYPLPRKELSRREIAAMGGSEKVLELARRSLEQGEARWALHLLSKLLDVGSESARKDLKPLVARALREVGKDVYNTNGRGYLLQSALEYEGKGSSLKPEVSDALLAELPVSTFFDTMATRLKADEAKDVEETLKIHFRDLDEDVFVTVRKGVAEVAMGTALPGTPEPFATLTTDSLTWKRMALGKDSPLSASLDERLSVEGELLRVRSFTERFDKGL
ncbi:MAG: MBL fold metallo-hydrolase [Myxococcales bacterium]|nr:MBL fold metallo-hydrolase [Myxococcales bacterium]